MAYLSKVIYNGDGVTKNYTIPFSYINKSYIKVKVNGVIVSNYTFMNENTISFDTAPVGEIKIYRETPKNTSLVSFYDTSLLKKEVLETSNKQILHILQELFDNITTIEENTISVFYNKTLTTNVSLTTTYTKTIIELGTFILLYFISITANGKYDISIKCGDETVFSAVDIEGNFLYNECVAYKITTTTQTAPITLQLTNKNESQSPQNININMLYSVG